MKVDQMREEIAKAYAGPKWQARVKAMSDRQVIAIYRSMQSEGRFDTVKPKKQEPNRWVLPQYRDTLMNEHAEQLSMWDFWSEK